MFSRMLKARDCGVTRCGMIRRWPGDRLEDLLLSFGLDVRHSQIGDKPVEDLLTILRPINQYEAIITVRDLLWKDQAYHVELMPLEQAQELAAEFISLVCSDEATYYTNLGIRVHTDTTSSLLSSPLTDSTCDGGVLVLEKDYVACFWVEDED